MTLTPFPLPVETSDFDQDQLTEDFEIEESEDPADPTLLSFLDRNNLVDELIDADGDAARIINSYHDANNSMQKWRKKYKKALKLAKLEPEADHKTFPFDGASVVMMPFILESMLDFSSRAAPDLVWTKNVVNGRIYGKNTSDKNEREERVAEYMNHQLSEMIPNWRHEYDKALLTLACVGSFYKKTYWDSEIGEVRSDVVSSDELIFNQDYKCFEEAPDKFQLCKYSRNEVISFIRGDQKWAMDENDFDEDEPDFTFYECYTWLDLDEDGLTEPYIVIICEKNEQIVFVAPYFDEDSIIYNDDGEVIRVKALNYFTPYTFIPDPAGGPLGLGWGILLGPMYDAINTTIRQLIDAGTLSNTAANSGLINIDTTTGRGNSIQSGPIEVKMGQLTPVTTRGTSGSLSQNVVQFPFSGPNQTLFQLTDYLIGSSRNLTTAASTIEANAGEAASLYLARLQQGLKVPNAIIMRVYESAKEEFKKIARLNHKHYSDKKYNRVLDRDQNYSMEQDFNPKDCDIVMVSDPSKGSELERAARASAVLEEAKVQPAQILNLRQAYIDWLEVMKTPDIDLIAPEPTGEVDPMQQMFLAQQQMEAEFRNRDMAAKERRLMLEEQRTALEAAKQMSNLGIQADKTESEIALNYAKALKTIVDSNDQKLEQSIATIKNIEESFIGEDINGSRETARSINSIPSRPLVGEPSNADVP